MRFKNLAAYLAERFPLINMALFAILFLTVYSVASFFAPATGINQLSWREGLGMLATISFFFRLRVFDEMKDFTLDAINHPQRVLQSGRVSLQQLFNVSLAGATLEISWSALMGRPTLVTWLLVLVYSLLMRYEFFASHFLKKRLVLYAMTHMLIMPLIILWIWLAYAPGAALDRHFLVLALLSLLGGFSFEIARKIHAPEAEKELIDSYSKSIGYAGAIFTVLLILLGGVAVQAYLLHDLRAGVLPFAILGLLYLTTLLIYLFSLNKPREKTLKLAELFVSLFMLVSYVSVIVVVHF